MIWINIFAILCAAGKTERGGGLPLSVPDVAFTETVGIAASSFFALPGNGVPG